MTIVEIWLASLFTIVVLTIVGIAVVMVVDLWRN